MAFKIIFLCFVFLVSATTSLNIGRHQLSGKEKTNLSVATNNASGSVTTVHHIYTCEFDRETKNNKKEVRQASVNTTTSEAEATSTTPAYVQVIPNYNISKHLDDTRCFLLFKLLKLGDRLLKDVLARVYPNNIYSDYGGLAALTTPYPDRKYSHYCKFNLANGTVFDANVTFIEPTNGRLNYFNGATVRFVNLKGGKINQKLDVCGIADYGVTDLRPPPDYDCHLFVEKLQVGALTLANHTLNVGILGAGRPEGGVVLESDYLNTTIVNFTLRDAIIHSVNLTFRFNGSWYIFPDLHLMNVSLTDGILFYKDWICGIIKHATVFEDLNFGLPENRTTLVPIRVGTCPTRDSLYLPFCPFTCTMDGFSDYYYVTYGCKFEINQMNYPQLVQIKVQYPAHYITTAAWDCPSWNLGTCKPTLSTPTRFFDLKSTWIYDDDKITCGNTNEHVCKTIKQNFEDLRTPKPGKPLQENKQNNDETAENLEVEGSFEDKKQNFSSKGNSPVQHLKHVHVEVKKQKEDEKLKNRLKVEFISSNFDVGKCEEKQKEHVHRGAEIPKEDETRFYVNHKGASSITDVVKEISTQEKRQHVHRKAKARVEDEIEDNLK